MTIPDAVANYNGLQTTVRQALKSGLMFGVSYTWSHALDEASKIGNREIDNVGSQVSLDKDNPAIDYGRSGYDQRHTISFNSSYDFPFDRYLTNGAAKALLGGWGVKGVWQFGSGLPLNVNLPFNNARNRQTGAAERPSLLPGASNNPTDGVTTGCGPIPAGQKLRTPDRWFDPCAFTVAPAGTWGNLGRDTIDGPPWNSASFTLAKDTQITEGTKLEFRAEVFNLFNHPSFGLAQIQLFDSASSRQHTGSEGTISDTSSNSRQIQLGMKLIF
jgi:hypothetical protein